MFKYLLLFTTSITLFGSNEMGGLLFDGNCVTCHYKLENRSAPAMIEVRRRYKKAFPIKKDFVKYLSEWVKNPSAQKSIMQDAIAKYELMPQLGYEKEVLQEIAAYIYDTDFTQIK